jgi:hypothetical protein
MRCTSLFFLLVTFLQVNSQEQKEFEGIIRYRHSFIFISPGIDTAGIISSYGTYSVLIYKKGNYKWSYNTEDSVISYFDDSTQTGYIRFGNTGSLFKEQKKNDDDVITFKPVPGKDTVSGYICDMLEIFTNTNSKSGANRKVISYCDAFPVAKSRFHSAKGDLLQAVYKIKKWPLRIRRESMTQSFIIISEAIEIIPLSVPDARVCLPKNVSVIDQ